MKILIAIACALLLSPTYSHASLIGGKTLEGTNSAGSFLPSSQAIVGAGVEYTSVFWNSSDWFQVDISDSGLVEVGIKNTALGHGASHLLTFTDVFSDIPDFTSFTFLTSGGGVSGFDQSKLSYSVDNFSIQLGSGVSWGTPNEGFIQAQLGIASVPTPATLALFGLGLAGLGWSRRKKA